MKANDHWNYWMFQLHWKKLEWVDPKKINSSNNPLCSLTHKFYIKDGKQTCHFVGHSKLKPIDCVALFKIQEESAALTASIASSNVAQISKISSTTSSTSVKKRLMKHQVTQHIENLNSSDVVSIENKHLHH